VSAATLEERVAALETRLEACERHLRDAAEQVSLLVSDLTALRARFNSFQPEGAHCPKCKARVHQLAVSCRHCSHKWGPPPPDPKRGLPRE